MHYGIEIVPFGELADPRLVVRLARAAQDAGWESIWVWDHLVFPWGTGDPWVDLSAVAAVCPGMKLVCGVAALPRYRPQVLARMLTSIDYLSGGNLIFCAGAGIDSDYLPFNEQGSPAIRAEMLDESLEVICRLWTGEPVSFEGKHYTLNNAISTPAPLQQPHPPVWIGGLSNAALRRAARWNGWIIGTVDENQQVTLPPDRFARKVQYIHDQRRLAGVGDGTPFDIAVDGITRSPGDSALVREYESAGATWYHEILFGFRGSNEELLARIHAGPPG